MPTPYFFILVMESRPPTKLQVEMEGNLDKMQSQEKNLASFGHHGTSIGGQFLENENRPEFSSGLPIL
jgi:hypothetical protein